MNKILCCIIITLGWLFSLFFKRKRREGREGDNIISFQKISNEFKILTFFTNGFILISVREIDLVSFFLLLFFNFFVILSSLYLDNYIIYFNDETIEIDNFLKKPKIFKYSDIVSAKVLKKFVSRPSEKFVLYTSEYKVVIIEIHKPLVNKLKSKGIKVEEEYI